MQKNLLYKGLFGCSDRGIPGVGGGGSIPPPPLGPNFWVIPCSCPSFFNYRCSGRTPTSTKLQRIPCSCPSFLTIDTVEELHLKVEECDF